jgi:hypothetical protein
MEVKDSCHSGEDPIDQALHGAPPKWMMPRHQLLRKGTVWSPEAQSSQSEPGGLFTEVAAIAAALERGFRKSF